MTGRTRHLIVLAANLAVLASASASWADGGIIKIGVYSQKESTDHASAGARVTVVGRRPGRPGRPAGSGTSNSSGDVTHVAPPPPSAAPTVGGAASNLPGYPTLASDSPLLQNAAPFGPGTFWYQGAAGTACVYAAGTSPLCYTITGAAAGPARPPLDPTAIAASLAGQLDLTPGELHASPHTAGLTGAASWLWLDPAPTDKELSISLAGEAVSVSAQPAVEWRFGDGATIAGGAGRPYQAGPPPPDAIVHTYQTRCLPGDRGHDPYVLTGCESDGYHVEALVSWRISYRASGRVDQTGTLPPRTTETGIVYPVGEARAFLVGGGTQ